MTKFSRLSSIIAKKHYKYLILAVFSLILISVLWLLWQKTQVRKPQGLESFMAYQKVVEKLNKKWIFGSSKGSIDEVRIQCPEYFPDLKKIELEDLRCNPDFLDCILSGRVKSENPIIKVKVDGVLYNFKPKKKGLRFLEAQGKSRYQLMMSYKKESFQIELINKCHQIELPENIYQYGDDFLWDNYHRKILIDKYYVTNRQVNEWKKSKGRTDLKPLIENYWPSVDLTLKERQDYCHHQGKKLLQAHVFEAVSHFYIRKDEKTFERSKYPWTKKSRTFLQKRVKPTREDCHYAYVKGCDSIFPFANRKSLGLGQIGVAHTIGSFLESVHNIYEPRKNLKVSSLFIEKGSSWNEVGRYALWDGEGLNESHIDWDKDYPRYKSDQYPIAFRCQQEVFK
jgi:hypothetical protein